LTDRITDIWAGVLEGDHGAWKKLVAHYATLVFAVARKKGLTAADAEDCAQQVWLALYKGRHRVIRPESLPAWLVSTTGRKATRMILRQKTATRTRSELATGESEAPPDDTIMRLQRRAQLELALEQLDDRCRKLMHAIFLSESDQTYQEIARSLGIPLNSLGPTRARCLKKLRKILEDFDL
jgi:RNA polymerase sigma factor (sigma-70 family)